MAKKQRKYDISKRHFSPLVSGVWTLENAVRCYLALKGAESSMDSAGGRCHDNARYESMWTWMKEKLLYDRYNTEEMSIDEIKTLIWGYTSSVIGITGGYAPLMVGFLLWSKDRDIMSLWVLQLRH